MRHKPSPSSRRGLKDKLLNECLLPLTVKHLLHAGVQLCGLQHWPDPNIRCNTIHSNPHCLRIAVLHHSLSIIPVSPFDKTSYLHKLLDCIFICQVTRRTKSESQVACKNCNESLALQLSCASWAQLPSVHQMET